MESDSDFLAVLFGGVDTETIAANEAEIAAERARDAAERAADAARVAAIEAERRARACRKCGGSGRISAFQHHKGGACFACCGTGVR